MLFARVTAGVRNQWIRSVQRAIHTHDVRSLVLAGPKLLSGGKFKHISIAKEKEMFNHLEMNSVIICILLFFSRSGCLSVHLIISSKDVK